MPSTDARQSYTVGLCTCVVGHVYRFSDDGDCDDHDDDETGLWMSCARVGGMYYIAMFMYSWVICTYRHTHIKASRALRSRWNALKI